MRIEQVEAYQGLECKVVTTAGLTYYGVVSLTEEKMAQIDGYNHSDCAILIAPRVISTIEVLKS